MDINSMFPSKYLKKEDFPQPTVLTIKLCAIEEVAKGETKPILYFTERAKGIVLNKTKATLLGSTFGNDSDSWAGRKVRLSIDPTVRDLAGNVVGGIKLECSKGAAPPKPVVVPLPADSDDLDAPF
jgi:hypothetical protein